MSIASEITRINNNIASAYSQCQSKGATMPATQNSDNLANTISTISGGGGADLDNYFNRTIDFVSTSSSVWSNKLIKKVPTLTIASGITSLEYAFYNLGQSCETIVFEGLDCSGITSLNHMLACASSGARPVKTFDLTNITNTTSVNDVSYLFANDYYLDTIINLFPVSGTVNIRGIFDSCPSIKYVNLSNWHITNIPSSGARSAFYNAYKITTLDISGMDLGSWPTTSTYSNSMFNLCGRDCLQSDGAYADGIPYVYVKDATAQNWVLTASNGHPSTWSTNNVVIKSS